MVIKHLVFKNEDYRPTIMNCDMWPMEVFLVVSIAGRLTEPFFISVLHSPQAALSKCHREAKLSLKGKTERWTDRKHILKIRLILQKLSNLWHG